MCDVPISRDSAERGSCVWHHCHQSTSSPQHPPRLEQYFPQVIFRQVFEKIKGRNEIDGSRIGVAQVLEHIGVNQISPDKQSALIDLFAAKVHTNNILEPFPFQA